MKKIIVAASCAFLVLIFGFKANAQSNTTVQNLTLEVQPFSYVKVSGDESISLNALTENGPFQKGSNIDVYATNSKVEYATNSSDPMKILIKADVRDYDLRVSAKNLTADPNTMGSAGTAAAWTDAYTNVWRPLITDISQGGGTADLEWRLHVPVYTAPGNSSVNVTYQIVAQ